MCGRGVRPTRLCELNAPRQSTFCRDESRPDKPGAQGRTQTFNLWFVGPALRQLSYSGERLVVGVGIEPTFRVFQTRANPSQLSDLLRLLTADNADRKRIGARGETRTHDTGFAIRRLSRLATRANWNGRRGSNSRVEFGRLACFQLHHFREKHL